MLFAVLVVAVQIAFSQASQPEQTFAVATVDSPVHDFGKIKQGTPVTHEFKFVNTGKEPLIITNAQPSCGCTVPSWTREPIPPGGTGFVKATFNAAAAGGFNKSVTVTANVEGGVIMLTIRGEVMIPVPNE